MYRKSVLRLRIIYLFIYLSLFFLNEWFINCDSSGNGVTKAEVSRRNYHCHKNQRIKQNKSLKFDKGCDEKKHLLI